VLKIIKYDFYQCAAYLENTTFFSNIKAVLLPDNCTSQLQPSDFRIIHAFKRHFRKQFISKTAAMIDGGLLQDAIQTNLNVLSAKHFIEEAWSLITSSTIENCFMKYGFSTDHVSSNNDSAVKKMTGTVYNLLECSLTTT
jgi:hypothetical protein